MSPDDALSTYIDAAAPAGSAAFYALLFAPEAARRSVGAVLAFGHEMEILATRNAETAAFRLNWWHEELQRLAGGRPSHPVTHALGDASLTDQFAFDCLLDRVQAAAADLDGTRYSTLADLERHLANGQGALQALICRALGAERPAALRPYWQPLGIGLGLTQVLVQAPGRTAEEGLRLPLDLLTAAGVSRQDLVGDPSHKAWAALATSVQPVILSRFAAARTGLPGPDRGAQSPGLILAALHQRTVDRLPRLPPAAWAADTRRSSLAKLYRAWRTARRAARGAL